MAEKVETDAANVKLVGQIKTEPISENDDSLNGEPVPKSSKRQRSEETIPVKTEPEGREDINICDSDSEIKITVKTTKEKHVVAVDKQATMKQLKEKVAKVLKTPTEQLCLIYSGKVLNDNETLSDCNDRPSLLQQKSCESRIPNNIPDDSQGNNPMNNARLYKLVLKKLNRISSQMNSIDQRLKRIEDGSCIIKQNKMSFLEDLGLPIKTVAELAKLEKLLSKPGFFNKMQTSLSGIGGIDVCNITVNILKRLLTNAVAEMFSWAGAKQKRAFKELKLAKLIIAAVHLQRDTTELEVAQFIAKWLVQAKHRREREEKKSSLNATVPMEES